MGRGVVKEYNRLAHGELGCTPIERMLRGPDVSRPALDLEVMRPAFMGPHRPAIPTDPRRALRDCVGHRVQRVVRDDGVVATELVVAPHRLIVEAGILPERGRQR